MFTPKTEKIQKLAEIFPDRIGKLEKLFFGSTNVYIDCANIRPWSNHLKWHIDYKRLKQFLDSFNNIKSVKAYQGTLNGDAKSKEEVKELEKYGYDVRTKQVKIMRHSIDVSSIKLNSPALLNNFIRKCLLNKLDLKTIEHLNRKFSEMNKNGVYFIKDLKCNFDVEIGRDMLLDFERNNIETFVLWSGDSDFADPVEQLLGDNKKAVLCATARRVSKELGQLGNKGLIIFDIQKIRNFICWNKEIQKDTKSRL